MHKNIYWLFFLAVLGLCVLYYTMAAYSKIYNYTRLKASAPAKTVQGKLQVLSADEDAVWLTYDFTAGKVVAKGKQEIGVLPNTPAAERAMEDYLKKDWIVWYDPADLTFSSLKKEFPLKELISALLLWGIYLYFVGVGIYVKLRR